MQSTRNDRAAIAALLCACLLLNALLCSFNHARHAGLELLLGPGVFCLTDADGQPLPGGELPPADMPAEAQLPFNCPLCNPPTLELAALFCLAWLLLRRRATAVRLPRERRCKTPPRHCWPSLNPRASPSLTC